MPRVREPGGPGADAGDPGPAAGAPREHPAARLLRDAYPAARERDRAVRWLIWISWQLDGRRDLAWWEIPGWVGEPWLRYARTLTGAVLLGLTFGLGFGGYAWPTGLAVGGLAALIAVYLGNRLRPGKLRRGVAPQAMVPARPRTRRDVIVLVLAVATGLFLRPVLIRLWGRPVAGPPSASYRACRRSTAIDAAACLLTGLPLALAGLAAGEVGLAALAAVPAGFAVLTALAGGTVPALWQAELAAMGRLLSERVPGWLVRGLRWSLWLTGRLSPSARVATAATTVAAAALLTAAIGPAPVRDHPFEPPEFIR